MLRVTLSSSVTLFSREGMGTLNIIVLHLKMLHVTIMGRRGSNI